MKRIALLCTAMGMFVLTPSAFAYRAGPPAGRTGSPQSLGKTCKDCHGSSTGPGSVQIVGAPTRYRANQVYDLIVRVADPNKLGAGFEISVETASTFAGTLIVTDSAYTQFADSFPAGTFVEHTFDGVANAVANWSAMGKSADYHLRWQAPSSDVGVIKFWAAGNAINNNFSNSGDTIYLTNVSATFQSCPADLDGDGMVSAADLAILLGSWGTTGAADFDGGGVSATDLAFLLGSWGVCA